MSFLGRFFNKKDEQQSSDDKTSKARLLLLSKFLSPRTIDEFERWQDVLSEPPKMAIQRFQQEGLVRAGTLSERMEQKYGVPALKQMLKERELKVSGNKPDLIARLIAADSSGMQILVKDVQAFRCTEQGQLVAEQFLSQQKQGRTQTEHNVLDALSKQQFEAASRLVASYEAEQVFERGMNMNWGNFNPEYDVTSLRLIFSQKPKILGKITDAQLSTLRLAAGMMYLWGISQCHNWIPEDFHLGLLMDNDAAGRMLVFYAHHQHNMANYKQIGVKQVRVLGANDQNICQECRKLQSKTFNIGQMPELPYPDCTCELGCRCHASPIID